MSGGNSELLEVQEKLELLNAEYDKLNDEWTGRLAAQQDDFQREKYVRVKGSSFMWDSIFSLTHLFVVFGAPRVQTRTHQQCTLLIVLVCTDVHKQ